MTAQNVEARDQSACYADDLKFHDFVADIYIFFL